MPAERFYYPYPLNDNEVISVKDQEYHHLINVMRIRMGETIEIINGNGQLGLGTVSAVEKKQAFLKVHQVVTAPPPSKKLILAQAIPKLNRLECILEKGTELGMTEIWLFPSAHSEKKDFSDNQQQRLEGILIAATKQCGRLFLPKIIMMPPLKKWTAIPQMAFFGDIEPSAPWLPEEWKRVKDKTEAIIFIGPESGFNDEEILLLRDKGVSGVKLNENILRTDTAAIVALAYLTCDV